MAVKTARKARITGLRKSHISAHRCVQRIVETYRAADESTIARGLAWYGDALDVALQMTELDTDMSLEQAAAVLAALSPQTMWTQNVAAGLEYARSGRTIAGMLGSNYARAVRVSTLQDPVPTLANHKRDILKMFNFARNILGDTDAVTIDRWAVKVALGTDRDDHELILSRRGVYDDLADCYRRAAAELGVPASAVQAVTWCQIRGKAD